MDGRDYRRDMSPRWTPVLTLAAAAMLAAASPATADAPWSEPQPVAGAHLLRWEPLGPGFALKHATGLFGFTPGGLGVAVLGRDAGGTGITYVHRSGTTFGPLGASTFGGLEPVQMALYGREGMIVAGQADAPGDARWPLNREILLDAAVSRRAPGGAFTQRQVLAKGVAAGSPSPAVVTALAANNAGDAAAVVSVPLLGRTRLSGYRARLFVRRRGEASFHRVTDLGPRTFGTSPAALAVNPSGDVLAAWDDRESVWARLVTAGGSLRAAQRLGPGGSTAVFGSRMAAAMDTTRRAIVAWIAQRISGESVAAGAPGTVAFAYAPPYKAFGRAQVLERDLPKGPGLGIPAPGVDAALLRDRGVVAWTGFTVGRFAVRVVDVVSGRPIGAAVLSPAGTDARLRGLAIGPRGGMVAVWTSTTQRGVTAPSPPTGFFATARAATTTAWGPVETIAPIPDQGMPAGDALVGADPVSGQTVALWSPQAGPAPAATPVLFSVRSGTLSR